MANAEILNKHLCGFNLSLQRGSDAGVGLGTMYKTLIDSIIEGEGFKVEPKVFPVVFHVLENGGVDVRTSGSIDFDPAYILEHVNAAFLGANISFAPATVDPAGNLMAIPGLNFIDGLGVAETRTVKAADGSFLHTYRDDMVAVVPSHSAEVELTGVTLEYIYSTHRWAIEGKERYLNVFVVNRIKSGTNIAGKDSSVYMSSEHPYISEQLSDLPKFNCAIEFSGLGRNYVDKYGSVFVKGDPNAVETNFGYNYLQVDGSSVPYPSYLYKGGAGNIDGFRDRGRSLAHCFGHMLGLAHPGTQLGLPSGSCASATSVFSDTLDTATVYTDSMSDTDNVSEGEIGVLDTSYNTVNPCSEDEYTIFNSSLTHMTLSQRIGPNQTELGGPSTVFTADQVNWMHANCEVEFYGYEMGSGFYPGILKDILIHSSSVLMVPIENTDPCSTLEARGVRGPDAMSFNNIENKATPFNRLLASIKKLTPQQ